MILYVYLSQPVSHFQAEVDTDCCNESLNAHQYQKGRGKDARWTLMLTKWKNRHFLCLCKPASLSFSSFLEVQQFHSAYINFLRVTPAHSGFVIFEQFGHPRNKCLIEMSRSQVPSVTAQKDKVKVRDSCQCMYESRTGAAPLNFLATYEGFMHLFQGLLT